MNCFKKLKLTFDSFRNFASKITTPSHRFNHLHHYCCNDPSGKITSTTSVSSLITAFKPSFRNWGKLNFNNNYGLINNAGRKFYHVDRYRIEHFRPRGPKRWFQNRRTVFVVVVVSGGVLITLYFGNLETIPYTKRKHFIILSHSLERQIGEKQFEQLKAEYKNRILPALHPESIRVRLIAKDIIEALQRGLRNEHVWRDPGYASTDVGVGHEAAWGFGGDMEGKIGEDDDWHSEDEVLNDKWVQKSRQEGQARGLEPSTQHLEGLNWEVLVVHAPEVNAFCLPGGKIVVYTGFLNHFRADSEIATVIGHEVGHVVARHAAEGITKNLWVAILQIILIQFVSMPDLVSAGSNLLLKFPFSRSWGGYGSIFRDDMGKGILAYVVRNEVDETGIGAFPQCWQSWQYYQGAATYVQEFFHDYLHWMEMEADYIGLLLLASAGYDPRAAPPMYEKLDHVTGMAGVPGGMKDYLFTHPSGKKRAQVLAQSGVMDEALTIYRETRAGHGIEGFL
ncbi:hypothetical protein GIB67_035580 [Kingdonia uniflora]|uniref:Peptidase M48 domain-containing protein n=1 Tax=Kingdonia uniflora TaxID=39325 RepID=A0A7J7LD51_9MAGN|nr:hypothetical protein GIB67_035580 [Kingdonia uniflora]